jgi:hypothetical protein
VPDKKLMFEDLFYIEHRSVISFYPARQVSEVILNESLSEAIKILKLSRKLKISYEKH